MSDMLALSESGLVSLVLLLCLSSSILGTPALEDETIGEFWPGDAEASIPNIRTNGSWVSSFCEKCSTDSELFHSEGFFWAFGSEER